MNRIVRLAKEIDRELEAFHRVYVHGVRVCKDPIPKCSVCKCRLTEQEIDESLLDPSHMLLCDECFDEREIYAIHR